MMRGFIFKLFTYLICVSFLLQMGGYSEIFAEEKGKNFPLGGMVSRGEVKFEAKEKIWKKVEPAYFPVFQGSKIKTEKGAAIISLRNDNQIEMGPNTILFFDGGRQIRLLQGQINFHIGSPEGISIKVGKVTVANSPYSQVASTNISVSEKKAADIGTVILHLNDSVTIQSNQGQFFVFNQQRVVLAALSSKESLRIPSNSVGNPPAENDQKMIFAQVGEITPSPEQEPETYLGLSKWTWAAIGLGALVVAGIGIAAAGGGGGGGGSSSPAPICR
jgi:hypothetical protein